MPRTPRTEVGQPIASAENHAGHAGAGTGPTPWAQVDSGSPMGLIANLRSIGCPEQTIRDIVLLRLCREHRDRLLAAEAQDAPSWDYTRNRPPDYWARKRAAQNQMRNELSATLESLLGWDLETLRETLLAWPACGAERTSFLTAVQRRQVREVEARYRELEQDLSHRGMMGVLDSDDRAQLRKLEAQKRAELAARLYPRQLEEYLYRNSSAAAYVRNHLPPAKSEAEFRLMVKVALELDMVNEPHPRFCIPGSDDPGAQEAEARKAALQERLKQVLGEERVAQQQAEEQARLQEEKLRRDRQCQERGRAQIIDLGASVGINREDAGRFCDRLEELKPVIEAKLKELEKNLAGTPVEQKKQLQTRVAAEFEKIAVEVLGERGRALVEKLRTSAE